MRRVATGELQKRLRNCVTGRLTENPARVPRGVRSFPASCGKGLGAAIGAGWTRTAPPDLYRRQILSSGARRGGFLSVSLSAGAHKLTAALRTGRDRNLRGALGPGPIPPA
jgi:hypothetical protein